ncbi:MAG: phytanoyl-CoA dioxygenase family protein, partial [Planctomycetota bacterium]
ETAARFARDGVLCVESLLPADRLAWLREAFAAPLEHGDGRRAGVRGLLESMCPQADAVRALAVSPEVHGFAAALIGPDAVAVRGTLFDKSPEANWGVPWHRDERLELAGRVESSFWQEWKRSEGRWTARPPQEFLLKMVAVRVHLDDCGPGAGPLRVRLGSHRTERDDAGRAVACVTPAGGAVAMCPAALHASGWAEFPQPGGRRRVIHLEYGPPDLPYGGRWRHQLRPDD